MSKYLSTICPFQTLPSIEGWFKGTFFGSEAMKSSSQRRLPPTIDFVKEQEIEKFNQILRLERIPLAYVETLRKRAQRRFHQQ